VKLYAESSAVLAWLMGEPEGAQVLHSLSDAQIVTASDLTLVETDRVLIRSVVAGDVSEAQAAARRAVLNRAAVRWSILKLHEEMMERARRPFPCEPVRTLDALHLACALVARSAIPDLALLSLDHRIRSSAKLLGFDLIPREQPGESDV
jgi:predicted nucleic acid-binding protein